MAIPAYLWLKDDGSADIKGSVDVRDREGSIEITGFSHNLSIPTDGMTGKLTGTRNTEQSSSKKNLIALPLIYIKPLLLVKRLNLLSSNGTKLMTRDRKRNTSIFCLRV